MAKADLFSQADTLGDTGPGPGAADIAIQAMMRGEEFRNVYGKSAVLAFQQSGDGIDFFGRWRDVDLLVPHDGCT